MTTKELKQKLMSKIDNIEDEKVLNDIIKLLDLSVGSEELYILSEKEKLSIEKARLQVKNGEIITNEQVSKELDQWLNT